MKFSVLPLLTPFLLSPTLNPTHAQTPDLVPYGGGSCSTEEDCSLGGVCDSASHTCTCDPWFTGSHCALLNLQAPTDMQGGTCGKDYDSYFSWGGRTILEPSNDGNDGSDDNGSGSSDSESGTHHLYVSFMCNHNTLSKWTTVSASAHLVSTAGPMGPFTWSEEQCDSATGVCTPAIVPWSHNTVALRMEHAEEDKRWQIWHIGDGVANESLWSPCFNKSDLNTSNTIANMGHGARNGGRSPDNEKHRVASRVVDRASKYKPSDKPGPGNEAFVSYAASPSGPWTRANNNKPVAINFTGAWTQELAGNPAPLELPDGRVALYFTARPCPPNSGALEVACIARAVADSWDGIFQMDAAKTPLTYPESEDPSVFIDPRGNYHMLTNVNTGHARCKIGIQCGGHAWSRDGLHFSNLTIGAFGPYITLANGTGISNAYVERPLVLQHSDRTPYAFYVGMGRSAYQDSCNWPQLFCTGKPREICGPTLTPPNATLTFD